MKALTIIGLLIILLVNCVVSWEQEGHMLVAQIAYNLCDNQTLTHVDDYIKIYENMYPDLSNRLSASVWADMIKSDHIYAFGTWHFIDQAYNPQNVSDVPEPEDANVVWALGQASTTLSGKSDRWGEGFMIRMLLHLVGDIHQPFHNVALYSHRFPHGDRGGNSFLVYVNGKKSNLHTFWDSIGGTGSKRYHFPLTDNDREHIEKRAKELMDKWGPIHVDNVDFHSWSEESYNLAITNGYGYLDYGQELDAKYIQQCQSVCEQQIVKAGYRLGHILSTL